MPDEDDIPFYWNDDDEPPYIHPDDLDECPDFEGHENNEVPWII